MTTIARSEPTGHSLAIAPPRSISAPPGRKRNLAIVLSLLSMILAIAWIAASCSRSAATPSIPVIVVTDLYHPHQDVGDNFDLLTAYALPELDLRAIILDCTELFRQPVATNAPRGLYPDPDGPREAGFIPVLQLNALFDRRVPFGTIPFALMKAADDPMRDAPAFQQQGIDLMLETLRASRERVHIVSFGSARAIAAAYNRDPHLFRNRLARLHLCAGAASPPVPGYLEWNVALDPLAIVRLLQSPLPITLYPCAASESARPAEGKFSPAHSYDPHNTYYKLPDLKFVAQMDPPLRRYIEYAFTRSTRPDFLRALEWDQPSTNQDWLAKEHHVWETAVWIGLTGRKLVQRSNGSHAMLPPADVRPSDIVLPNELQPCHVTVHPDGVFECAKTNRPTRTLMYYRGNPRTNEIALREALPALYLTFQSSMNRRISPSPGR